MALLTQLIQLCRTNHSFSIHSLIQSGNSIAQCWLRKKWLPICAFMLIREKSNVFLTKLINKLRGDGAIFHSIDHLCELGTWINIKCIYFKLDQWLTSQGNKIKAYLIKSKYLPIWCPLIGYLQLLGNYLWPAKLSVTPTFRKLISEFSCFPCESNFPCYEYLVSGRFHLRHSIDLSSVFGFLHFSCSYPVLCLLKIHRCTPTQDNWHCVFLAACLCHNTQLSLSIESCFFSAASCSPLAPTALQDLIATFVVVIVCRSLISIGLPSFRFV